MSSNARVLIFYILGLVTGFQLAGTLVAHKILVPRIASEEP